MIRKSKTLPHCFSISELAHLISRPPELIDRLCRCGIHPPWLWREHWKQPRFALETVPEWLRILDGVDLDSLPENPPPLQRPVDLFQESRTVADPERIQRARGPEHVSVVMARVVRMVAQERGGFALHPGQ